MPCIRNANSFTHSSTLTTLASCTSVFVSTDLQLSSFLRPWNSLKSPKTSQFRSPQQTPRQVLTLHQRPQKRRKHSCKWSAMVTISHLPLHKVHPPPLPAVMVINNTQVPLPKIKTVVQPQGVKLLNLQIPHHMSFWVHWIRREGLRFFTISGSHCIRRRSICRRLRTLRKRPMLLEATPNSGTILVSLCYILISKSSKVWILAKTMAHTLSRMAINHQTI